MELRTTDKKTERKKTKGESLFDWSVYGGIGWVANAILSVFITDQLYNNKTPLIPTNEGKISIKQQFSNWEGWLKKQNWNVLETKFPGFTRKAVFSGSLCIGGSLIVPVIKWFEDRKGSIVRKWDEKFYGARAHTDPDIVQAHQEMDTAPRQSWISLLGARATVIGIAFAMGPTIGDYNGVSGRALGKIPFVKNFSSFEGFGASFSRTLAKGYDWFNHSVLKRSGKPLMDPETARLHPLKIQNEGLLEEHRALKIGEITGYELTQSASIAGLFYVISKAFAGLRHDHDTGNKPRQHIPSGTVFHVTSPRRDEISEAVKGPQTTISAAVSKDRVNQPETAEKRAAGI